MQQKLRVALLFGGRSAEHDVSLMSAANVYRALDPARYKVVPIAVTRSGAWTLCPLAGDTFPTQVPGDGPLVTLLPGGGGRLLVVSSDGAAVGVGKADTIEEFEAALREALRHDRKVLIEECVRGREVECGVLEGEDGALAASVPGEIIPTNRHAFYTYEAKYLDRDGAELKVPADLPRAVAKRVQDMSLQAFRALGCEAMARVDFFLRPDMSLVVNEINTIPGF